jgi:hypothetical protein
MERISSADEFDFKDNNIVSPVERFEEMYAKST